MENKLYIGEYPVLDVEGNHLAIGDEIIAGRSGILVKGYVYGIGNAHNVLISSTHPSRRINYIGYSFLTYYYNTKDKKNICKAFTLIKR